MSRQYQRCRKREPVFGVRNSAGFHSVVCTFGLAIPDAKPALGEITLVLHPGRVSPTSMSLSALPSVAWPSRDCSQDPKVVPVASDTIIIVRRRK